MILYTWTPRDEENLRVFENKLKTQVFHSKYGNSFGAIAFVLCHLCVHMGGGGGSSDFAFY